MPPVVVTVTSTGPALWPGATAVIVVGETTVKDVAGTVPKLTPVTCVKFVPVMVTTVPPVVEPPAAVEPIEVPRLLMVGGAAGARNVNRSAAVTALVPLRVWTTMSAVTPPEGGTPTKWGTVTLIVPSGLETTNVAGWETCPTTNVTD